MILGLSFGAWAALFGIWGLAGVAIITVWRGPDLDALRRGDAEEDYELRGPKVRGL